LDALLTLRRQHALTANNVEHILVKLPADGARVVDNSAMPDVNLQHLISVALIDGAVSFSDSHSHERMKDPAVLAVRARVQLVGDKALMVPDAPRSGFVEVRLRDGRTVNHFTRHAPGTKENPLDTDAVNAKARGLMEPVLGARRTGGRDPAGEAERPGGAPRNVRELGAVVCTPGLGYDADARGRDCRGERPFSRGMSKTRSMVPWRRHRLSGSCRWRSRSNRRDTSRDVESRRGQRWGRGNDTRPQPGLFLFTDKYNTARSAYQEPRRGPKFAVEQRGDRC
jgi:hypothetical protein